MVCLCWEWSTFSFIYRWEHMRVSSMFQHLWAVGADMELAWRSALFCQTNTSSQQPVPLAFPQVRRDIRNTPALAALRSRGQGNPSPGQRGGPDRPGAAGREGQRGGSITFAGGSRELLNIWLLTKWICKILDRQTNYKVVSVPLLLQK